jgi:hypothetical protein
LQFVDLKRQYDEYKTEIMAEIQQVLDTTAFINGLPSRSWKPSLPATPGSNTPSAVPAVPTHWCLV